MSYRLFLLPETDLVISYSMERRVIAKWWNPGVGKLKYWLWMSVHFNDLTVLREKVTAVSLCLRLQYCQSCQFSQDDGFCGEDDGFCMMDFVVKTMDFVVKTTAFWQRWRIFYFFFIFAKNPSSSPHCLPCVRHMLQCLHCILMSEAPTLSMFGHTNDGNPLYWACATCCTGHVQT